MSTRLVLLSLSLFAARSAQAASITEDFNGADPYVVWAQNGAYVINEKRIVDAGGGEKALLIDVTLQTATYLYFTAPLPTSDKIPLVDLHVDGDVKVETVTGKGSVTLGATYALPSIYGGMALPVDPRLSTATAWTHQSGAWTQDSVRWNFLRSYLPQAQSSEVPIYVHKGVVIYITADPGTRFRFLVDRLSISGDNPTVASYSAATDPLFAAYRIRISSEIAAVVDEIRRFQLPTPHDPNAETYLASVQAEAQAILAAASSRGVPSITEHKRLHAIKDSLPSLLIPVAPGAYSVYILDDPFGGQKVIPTHYPVPGVAGNVLKLRAAPGEIESGSFVIKSAGQSLSNIALTVTPPAGWSGPDALSAKWVKSWFQSGEFSIGVGPAFYTPELLVNDLELVHVDTATKKNYLRASVGGVSGYYDITLTTGSGLPTGAVVMDAPVLTAASIPAQWNQQVWVTVRVPADAAAGRHQGRVDIDVPGLERTSITVDVEVLPFALAPSLVEHGIYYAGTVVSNSGVVDNMYLYSKSEKQVLLELQDLKAHGVLYPSTYQGLNPTNNYAATRRALALMKQAGLPTDKIRTLGTTTNEFAVPLDPATLQAKLTSLTNNVKTWQSIAAQEGFGTVYVYGRDEASGPGLSSQRAAWQRIRDLGAKVFVACYQDAFALMGDVLDFPILAGAAFSKTAVDAWHAQGASIGMYANPQVGVEEPLTYRKNYGLALFTQGYDAAYDFAYHWYFGKGYGSVWNDFDHAQYSEHNFVYPTSDGLVGTIQWEGYREGVNDTRYLATLLARDRRETQDSLRAWVKSRLDAGTSLESIRSAVIARIMAAPGDPAPPVLSSVQVVTIDSTTVSVRWDSDKDCDSRVEFSSAPAAGVGVARDSRWLRSHALRLGALQAGADYSFRVFSKDLLGRETGSQPLVFNTGASVPANPKQLRSLP